MAKTKATIQDVLAGFEKEGFEFGYKPKEQKFFSTGNVGLDWVCGGGVPVGQIVECYGKSGSGKTTFAYQVARQIQQEGGTIALADFERAFDADYAQALGIDIYDPSFIYFKPGSLEEGGNIMSDLVTTGQVDFVIVDSTARMTAKSELEGRMEDATVADKAKALYKFCRKILNALDDNNCTLLFLNHLLEAINTSMPGVKQKTTPGGNAVPYFASLRLEAQLIKSNTVKGVDAAERKYDSVDVQFMSIKNRAAPPFRKTVLHNEFGSGFSQIRSAIDMSSELKLIDKSSAWTKVLDPELVRLLGKDSYQGYDKFIDAVEANPEARGTLISKAIEAVHNR